MAAVSRMGDVRAKEHGGRGVADGRRTSEGGQWPWCHGRATYERRRTVAMVSRTGYVRTRGDDVVLRMGDVRRTAVVVRRMGDI